MTQELLDSEAPLPSKFITRLVDFIQNTSKLKKVGYILSISFIETTLIFNLSRKSFSWMEIIEVFAALLGSTVMYGFGIYLLVTGISFFIQKVFAFNPKVNELDIISTTFILSLFLFLIFCIYVVIMLYTMPF